MDWNLTWQLLGIWAGLYFTSLIFLSKFGHRFDLSWFDNMSILKDDHYPNHYRSLRASLWGVVIIILAYSWPGWSIVPLVPLLLVMVGFYALLLFASVVVLEYWRRHKKEIQR